MPYLEEDIHQLAPEHGVLLRRYGELQRRCTEHANAQAQEIVRLQQQVMRLRAQLIQRDSALAWEREDRQRLLAAIADWPELALAQHPDAGAHADAEWLEHSLRCADLVICQTGCASHGAFWRVEDHCKRTGKTCVLVEQPGALRIVRVHPAGQAEPEACAPLDHKDMP
ncbi:DUF2325 domain-containing protein [Acidovorax sp. YS12]|nr:DUF2325 domain-containing protein [Acidovorax sp. YS12]